MQDVNRNFLITRGSALGVVLLLGSFATMAEDDVGSEDVPWVVADEDIEEAVEVIPDTEEELKATAEGVAPRGLIEDEAKVLVEGQRVFIEIMKDMAQRLPVRSTGCDRDDLMAANTMLILGSAAMVPGMTAFGAATGGIAGIVGGAIATAYVSGIPGAATMGSMGAVAGAGAGFTAGGAQFGLTGIFVANNVQDVVRTTEPCSQTQAVQARGEGSGGGSESESAVELPGDLDEAQFWVDLVEDESGVSERAARRTSAYAGQYESLYIHIIQKLYTDNVYDLARNWERSRYIPANARAILASPAVRSALKPAIDHLAYVKRYGKLPDGLPARPLDSASKFAYAWLTGDTAAMRDGWLAAMGMGSTRLKMRNGRLSWTTPSALRLVGLPPTVSGNVGNRSVSVGSLRASVTPGPFDVVFGKASLSGNRVKVNYSIERNSRAGAASAQVRLPTGQWNTFFNFSPRLQSNLNGSVYYKFTSAGPAIDTVSFGNASISMPTFAMPPVPGLDAYVNNLRTKVEAEVKKIVTSALPIRNIFDQAAPASKKSLLKEVKKQAGQLGFNNIDRIASISISNGQLKVRVGGYKAELALPPLPDPAALRSQLAKYVQQLQGATAQMQRQKQPMRPMQQTPLRR
ncbi:hypothetical protein ACFL3A_03785 [Pseudomonadota bacterium]